jgi:hypothetical protein
MKVVRIFALLACLVGYTEVALSQTFPLTVSGKTATAAIELPGGYAADLSIEFEEVVGLHEAALEVSASVVSPFDSALLSRLPGGSLSPPTSDSLSLISTPSAGTASIPASFPVLLRIEPTSSSALAMAGIVTISLHTHNLTLNYVSPLGLFSASTGGPFREITRSVGMGSYRVDGSGGGFSEFVIAGDGRPIDTIIREKFDWVQRVLTDNGSAISPLVLDHLQQQLGLARSLYDGGQGSAAIGVLTGFGHIVKAHSGSSIPDVWRAHDSRTNVAGLLRSGADTLKFSLIVAANRLP